jgi:hypothetical protein
MIVWVMGFATGFVLGSERVGAKVTNHYRDSLFGHLESICLNFLHWRDRLKAKHKLDRRAAQCEDRHIA